MTNEELIKGLRNISCVDCISWNRDWGVCDADRKCMDYINEAIEAVGNSNKYRCESCKSYDYENNHHCSNFDIYCEEDFYCKDWSEA